MRRFKSAEHAQRFLGPFGAVRAAERQPLGLITLVGRRDAGANGGYAQRSDQKRGTRANHLPQERTPQGRVCAGRLIYAASFSAGRAM